MIYLDLIVLLVIVGFVSIWADRRILRKKQENGERTAENGMPEGGK